VPRPDFTVREPHTEVAGDRFEDARCRRYPVGHVAIEHPDAYGVSRALIRIVVIQYRHGDPYYLCQLRTEPSLSRLLNRVTTIRMKDRDVIVDYRPPNVVRVCPASLCTRFEDVYRAVERFRAVLDAGAYEAYASTDADVT
jgi:kynureninase